MIISRTGKIARDFYALGHASVPVYLLDDPNPVLFDAGFSGLAFEYEKGIRDIIGSRSPSLLFLTHSHWDHIGSVAHFKKCWSSLKTAGSPRIRQVLESPAAVRRIASLSEDALETLASWGITTLNRADFQPFQLDLPLEPATPVRLEGGTEIMPLATPGHTWDSYAYWIPSRKILIAGEAVVCDGICEFLVDYDEYLRSLRQLTELEVDVLCTGHQTVITGEDARRYITDSMVQTEEYLRLVKELEEEEHGNVKNIVTRIKALEWDNRPLPKQPERAYVMNTTIRVKNILEGSKSRKLLPG